MKNTFFFITTVFPLLATLASAESKFTVESVRGQLTASWKGNPAPDALDNAPTDDDIAALAAHEGLVMITISGASTFTGKGFAALKDLPNLREIRFNGTGPKRFSEVFPPGSLEGYEALAELDQVETLNFGHVMLSIEGTQILLRGMANLRNLLSGVYPDDRIIEAATKAPKLESLSFGHWATVPEARLTMQGAELYAEIPNLKSLGTGARLPENGTPLQFTQALAKVESLEGLNLSFGGGRQKEPPQTVTAEELAPLANLPSLDRLLLTNCQFAPGALTALKAAPSLTSLNFRNATVSSEDIAPLQAALPKLKIRGL